MKFSVTENGKTTHDEIGCIDCGGSGKMSAKQENDIAFQKQLWCNCSPAPGPEDIIYVPDGKGVVHKHHYICKECEKIVQIG